MQKTRRGLVLINRRSRSGAAAPETVQHLFHRTNLETVSPANRDDANFSDLILAHAREVDCVIVGGGDGTINAAARGLLATGLPLGILPLGTGNDLARTLGLPLDVTQAARVIADGHATDIDIGEVNGHPYFNVASLGLSVELARRLDPSIKRRFGRLGYIIGGLRIIGKLRPFRAVIHDGRRAVRGRTLQIAVGNGRYYGGGNLVSDLARIDDGKLQLYSLELKKIWRMVLAGILFRSGKHVHMNDVRFMESDFFEIRTRRPRSINVDGEIVTQTPAQFRVRRNAIKVYVPEGRIA